MPRNATESGPHPVDIHVGKRLAARRIGLGFNQSDLGRALGLTFQQVQKYEKGANRMSASKMHDAANFLGVTEGYFFEGLRAPADPNVESPVDLMILPHGAALTKAYRSLSDVNQRAVVAVARTLASENTSLS
ncbi:HTH-type transcriptional regulator cell division transcriptional repressor [Bajunvirus bajun]|uniref:HTH-type transcriptional regulator cell division transcriptional repressor n=1 Tax=Brevundimonas phage vB_BgoS-Bajun TaxID=2948594 RepID=A0A9E7N7B3_9CAUD|nr:HTH-type transcriptional regulator cell division transcriptional repressor [Brevundimonas phage vB_BgoS-Bajun]